MKFRVMKQPVLHEENIYIINYLNRKIQVIKVATFVSSWSMYVVLIIPCQYMSVVIRK